MPTPPTLTRFDEYCARKTAWWGARFSCAALYPRFVPYFNSGDRVRVRIDGVVITGTIAATTGWAPQFMVMRTSRSRGSSWLLNGNSEILAVKFGRHYIPVPKEAR